MFTVNGALSVNPPITFDKIILCELYESKAILGEPTYAWLDPAYHGNRKSLCINQSYLLHSRRLLKGDGLNHPTLLSFPHIRSLAPGGRCPLNSPGESRLRF